MIQAECAALAEDLGRPQARRLRVFDRSLRAGLRLEATDEPFMTGDGPVVKGRTLALTMAMAGQPVFVPGSWEKGWPP